MIDENLKIALAHDSFTQMGGAEKVIEQLHEIFPEAPVFTLVFDPKFTQQYQGWNIKTSPIQPLFLALGKLQYLLPLISYGVDNLDFSGYDLIISSSSGFIKNLRKPKNSIHVNYCHTPTRFLWSEPDYVNQETTWWQRPWVKIINRSLKNWDYQGAQRVSKFIANSQEVQKRIKQYYNRDSEVVYPGVDTIFWQPTTEKKDYFLIAGRLQAHKRIDSVIKTFNNLGVPLHVVGVGRQQDYLKSIAQPNVKFLGRISDQALRDEYSSAKAVICPQVEDFGLIVIEAASCGTAAVGLNLGGNLETIIPGVTGEYFNYNSGSLQSLDKVVTSWQTEKYSRNNLINHAAKFSKEIFKEKILDYIQKL